ncbi:MAG: hypothetical protein Q9163_003969 [Psora crenata]
MARQSKTAAAVDRVYRAFGHMCATPPLSDSTMFEEDERRPRISTPSHDDSQPWHEGKQVKVRLPHLKHLKSELLDNVIEANSHHQQPFSSPSTSFTLTSTSSSPNPPSHDQYKPRVKLPPLQQHPDLKQPLRRVKLRGVQQCSTSSQPRQTDQPRPRIKQNRASRQPQATSSKESPHKHQKRLTASLHIPKSSFTGMSSSFSNDWPVGPNQSAVTGIVTPTQFRLAYSQNLPQQMQQQQRHGIVGTMTPYQVNRSIPSPQVNRATLGHTNGVPSPSYQVQNPWLDQVQMRTSQELSVRLFGLPKNITTEGLRECFDKEGTVISIEIFDNTRGEWSGGGRIRFRFGLSSPAHLELNAETLDFGVMLQPSTMMIKRAVHSTSGNSIRLIQNMRYRELTVEFRLKIPNRRLKGQSQSSLPPRTEVLRFQVPFQQMQSIRRVTAPGNQLVLLMSLDTPPRFFKKLVGSPTHPTDTRAWNESDMWYRQTDIGPTPSRLGSSAVRLHKTKPILDLGRWTTYRLSFNMSRADEIQFNQMRSALEDYNIEFNRLPHLAVVSSSEPTIWSLIDRTALTKSSTMKDLMELAPSLSFEVRYQLEVCISHGILNEHNLTEDFVTKLFAMDQEAARDLLEHIANQKERVFDPMSIFNIQAPAVYSRARMPDYCTLSRSVTVTPTTLYFNTPTVETSNRIIRQYREHTDRFIRVRFTDEKLEGKVYSTHKDTMNEVFARVKRTMANGIIIGDRHYRFLASGNAQFREHGAYFFAPLPALSTKQIRLWMGSFTDIRGVALYNSRLGQCFSTTRAIATQTEILEIADIERNGFKFSDGVGKMSVELAHVTARGVGLLDKEPPSVFQFRLGGCKGVLAVWPELPGRQLHIRYTQYKFPASHEGLEIIRWSQFACANLNRQLILVLSALGVPDSVFVRKLKEELSDIEEAMVNPEKALAILQKDVDHNQMTLALSGMIIDGFQTRGEPFITSLLQLWRAWTIKYLKEKARITVSEGALLIGCLDETATLRGHRNNTPKIANDVRTDQKLRGIPEVFVQLSKGSSGKPQVILGAMILARNPSLHPGDIRVVCGVDVPQLRHLKDCVVLPQTGDRDIASMCSGGDLDGDDFTVIWDPDVLPREWNHEPMDYSAPDKLLHEGEITDNDITSFFVTYMKNDTLPTIAHAHVANADWFDEGVKHEKCLKLAALHSMAVDFVKTGQPAQMTKELRPWKWPHFMEKDKPATQTYISGKVLGQLYDEVERVAFAPAFTAPFDQRILNAFHLEKDMLDEAKAVKRQYDAHMHRIMAQHAIKTEFEVWSTFVLQHNSSNDFKFHEKIGSVSKALKEQFRSICKEKAGGNPYEQLGPFVAAMYKVTSDEMAAAVRECNNGDAAVGGSEPPSREMKPDTMPLISFPWLFQDMLGKIAKLNAFGPGQPDWTASQRSGTNIARNSAPYTTARKPLTETATVDIVDDITTAEGVTHRGDLLELQFGNPKLELDREHFPDRKNVIAAPREALVKTSPPLPTTNDVDSSYADMGLTSRETLPAPQARGSSLQGASRTPSMEDKEDTGEGDGDDHDQDRDNDDDSEDEAAKSDSVQLQERANNIHTKLAAFEDKMT